jgi:hypothetical protein
VGIVVVEKRVVKLGGGGGGKSVPPDAVSRTMVDHVIYIRIDKEAEGYYSDKDRIELKPENRLEDLEKVLVVLILRITWFTIDPINPSARSLF